MKCSTLFLNRDADYGTVTQLMGWSTTRYGSTNWDERYNKQVCRVPNEKWSMAMEEDILKLSHLRGNVWLRATEFETADGKRFLNYEKALAHESATHEAPSQAQQVIPSGIPVTIEAVEKAGSAKLRELARAASMPDFRKFSKADDLRPQLIAFLRAQEAPVIEEAKQVEAS